MFGPNDKIWMREAPAELSCEAHAWPTDGMGRELVEAMRERHMKGGIIVCRDCIMRAREDAKTKAGIV